MCGITGFWSFSNQLAGLAFDRIVQEMADQLTSRGPDSSGVWWEKEAQLAFGHRRLTIVDLSETGHQPMISSLGRFVITYNGEVYNAPELRKDLQEKGYHFYGTSDTEVIVTACEAYGVEKAAQLLIGMFAFALWDAQEKKLYLIRDRLGIKPLYWGIHNQTLFFASQLKSFRPHPLWQPGINQAALLTYFQFGYVVGSPSIYKDIERLRPGCMAIIEGKDSITIKPYWNLEEVVQRVKSQQFSFSSSQWVEQLDALLKDAVKYCMVSDVPVGAFLSGGIDSSLVVALMQAQSSNLVKTFSIGFEEAHYNEAKYAAAIASHLGTQHHELYLNPQEALEIIPTIPQWCDEPFADSSQIPTFLVSRLAHRHLKVCLSGDGGDELFAGYNRYFQANQLWDRLSLLPVFLRKMTAKGIQCFPFMGDTAYKFASLLECSNQHLFYFNFNSLWDDPESLVVERGLEKQDRSIPFPHSQMSFIEDMQYIDTLTYLPDDILAKVDYASMAVSLESRVPLLDHRVVEFAWSIPLDLKIKHPQGKWILREVLKRYIPEPLFERPKMGFGVPIDQWLRGPLRDWAEELLSPTSLKNSGLNIQPIQKRWTEHISGIKNWHYSLWSVLMFQAWNTSAKS